MAQPAPSLAELGLLVARQQCMISELLTSHTELLQAHGELTRGHASVSTLQDALCDCLCQAGVVTRSQVKQRVGQRSQTAALFEPSCAATVVGFASPRTARNASAASTDLWETLRVHLGMDSIADLLSRPASIVDIPPSTIDELLGTTLFQKVAEEASPMSSLLSAVADDQALHALRCVSKEFSLAVHDLVQEVSVATPTGVVNLTELSLVTDIFDDVSQVEHPCSRSVSLSPDQLTTALPVAPMVPVPPTKPPTRGARHASSYVEAPESRGSSVASSGGRHVEASVAPSAASHDGQACITVASVAGEAVPLEAEADDVVAALKEKVDRLSHRLAEERSKNDKLYEAGSELQDAYNNVNLELRETAGNAAYWRTLAEARAKKGKTYSGVETEEVLAPSSVVECWRSTSDNLNLCKAGGGASSGSTGGNFTPSIFHSVTRDPARLAASTGPSTPTQQQQPKRSRPSSTKGATSEVAEKRDLSGPRKNSNIAQGMLAQHLRSLPTAARSRSAVDSSNSFPREATTKAGRSLCRRSAFPTASTSGKNQLFGRLPPPPTAAPHPAGMSQRGALAVELSDSDSQSGTDGKQRVADLVGHWELKKQRHIPVEGAARSRRNTWTGTVVHEMDAACVRRMPLRRMAPSVAALTCMEPPEVDEDVEQRFDTELGQRLDMEVDRNQFEVGDDESEDSVKVPYASGPVRASFVSHFSRED